MDGVGERCPSEERLLLAPLQRVYNRLKWRTVTRYSSRFGPVGGQIESSSSGILTNSATLHTLVAELVTIPQTDPLPSARPFDRSPFLSRMPVMPIGDFVSAMLIFHRRRTFSVVE
jgi:hypothetical protein